VLQSYNKKGKELHMSNTEKILALGLTGFLALTAAPLVASAATTNTTVQVSVNDVITTFTTSGTVTLGGLTPDATGKQSINKDTVTVDTNDSDGYTLTLNDADGTFTLASGANSFAAGSGSAASPAALANNTWGWRVDGLSGFGAGPSSIVSNGSPSSLTFAGINATPVTVSTSATNGSSATEVWYSARADNTQPTGTYSDIVTYTATTN
jgi:hypothetical protein